MDPVHPKSTSPRYDLTKAKACVEGDRYRLGGRTGCLQHLEFHLHGEIEKYGEFVGRVFSELGPANFYNSQPWPPPDGLVADAYGVSLSDDTVDAFGLRLRNWYVKFHMQTERKSELVLFMSVHPLAWDIETLGGTIKAGQ